MTDCTPGSGDKRFNVEAKRIGGGLTNGDVGDWYAVRDRLTLTWFEGGTESVRLFYTRFPNGDVESNVVRAPAGDFDGEVDDEFIRIDPDEEAATILVTVDEDVGEIPAGEVKIGVRCDDLFGRSFHVSDAP